MHQVVLFHIVSMRSTHKARNETSMTPKAQGTPKAQRAPKAQGTQKAQGRRRRKAAEGARNAGGEMPPRCLVLGHRFRATWWVDRVGCGVTGGRGSKGMGRWSCPRLHGTPCVWRRDLIGWRRKPSLSEKGHVRLHDTPWDP